jgi:AraC-like DNA-binding protein
MRIEKFEELAKDQKNANLTHWALAQHAGFNSRSAFYRAYKKARNASPAKVLNAG